MSRFRCTGNEIWWAHGSRTITGSTVIAKARPPPGYERPKIKKPTQPQTTDPVKPTPQAPHFAPSEEPATQAPVKSQT